jgi:GAF domain-containing protein
MVLEKGQPVTILVSDPNADPFEVALMRQIETNSLLMLPLAVGDRIIGLVELEEDDYERVFTPAEIHLCQALAQQAAIAIENTGLHAETERRAQQLAVLHELDRAISSSLHMDNIYYAFALHAARLLPYDRMSIALLEGDNVRITYVAGDEGSNPIGTVFSPQATAIGQVIATGQPVLRHNIVAEAHFTEKEQPAGEGVQSTLIIPLRITGRVAGTLNLGSR